MASGPGIDIHLREKRFVADGEPLFGEFSLQIAPQSVTALVGPSGVGKSSLMRMIAGIDAGFDGEITIDGIAACDAPTPGFVLQDARLLPWLTAFDNIRAVAPRLPETAILDLLRQVGLREHVRAYPHELSGGMQRRVALARALSVNARLLLLDEPFVSLDRTLVGEIQELFSGIVAERRPTVVLVTHFVEDAARLADRVVTLAGRPVTISLDLALDIPRLQRSSSDRALFARQIEAGL